MKKYLFILLQLCLYIAFLYHDIIGKPQLSNILKMVVVCLCFIYVLLLSSWQKDNRFLKLGFLFTVISDGILLFLSEMWFIYGVSSFLIVQEIYGCRLYTMGTKHRTRMVKREKLKAWILRNLVILSSSVVVTYVLFIYRIPLNALIYVATFYGMALLLNVVYSFILILIGYKDRMNYLFAIGLLLFLLCDINVALHTVSSSITLWEPIQVYAKEYSNILIWVFYAPSQGLIALSHGGQRT